MSPPASGDLPSGSSSWEAKLSAFFRKISQRTTQQPGAAKARAPENVNEEDKSKDVDVDKKHATVEDGNESSDDNDPDLEDDNDSEDDDNDIFEPRRVYSRRKFDRDQAIAATRQFSANIDHGRTAEFIKRYLIEMPRQLYNHIKLWKKKNPKLFWFIVICLALGIFTSIALPIIGFGTGGVVAGSLAAFIHSLIGNVVAGSLFAGLQSLGALGTLTVVGGGIAAVGPAVVLAVKGWQGGWAGRAWGWVKGNRGNGGDKGGDNGGNDGGNDGKDNGGDDHDGGSGSVVRRRGPGGGDDARRGKRGRRGRERES